MTYAKAGVNFNEEADTIKSLVSAVSKTLEFRNNKVGAVKSKIGHFANLIEFGDKYLVLSTDGVGSKVLVAQLIDKYDTVGIDMIAMCVNDVICLGAEPISLVDYLAMTKTDGKNSQKQALELGKGLCEGARQAEIAIVGGETATLKEVINGIDDKGFDLAGAVLGTVDKDKVVLGDKIKAGDKIIGLASSGIHTNGITLARKVLLGNKEDIEKYAPQILTPTTIYVKPVLDVLDKCFNDITGLANITGGGILNIARLNDKIGYKIDKWVEIPPIFKTMQEKGNVDNKEMFRTFNMGVGFVIIAKEADKIIDVLKKQGIKASIIGEAVNENGIILEEFDVEFKEGY
ncbi:MAG: phosphoribosylformylglycinamidine cyclo-ligase [Candidatus Aenigmarchaeota archaeon]|nr:phosphoribosylformylglycinamidine cyclo-ligase [Candidatus Aenigmarchaeota archaeon]